MARPLRIQFANAWYHVMNRGRRSEKVFRTEQDYHAFIDLLKESCMMWHVRIGAYCLMSNHYHLLIQTPEANISRCMRHINGLYTQRFNRAYGSDGQLFRGRYKAILVDADSYLLELLRYIHRNPIRAGMVNHLDEYPWASHRGYVSQSRQWDWLNKDFILSLLTEHKARQRSAYARFIMQEEPQEIKKVFARGNLPSILGTTKFKERIRKKYFKAKHDKEIPESGQLAPNTVQIKEAVIRKYRQKADALYKPRRGTYNEPRKVAIYLTRKYTGLGLEQISQQFKMTSYSSVSSVIHRVRQQLIKDKRFKKRVASIEKRLL